MEKTSQQFVDAAIANGTAEDRVLFNDWHVLATVEELQPGTLKRSRLLGKDIVLWRGQDGEILAWQDRCPHRSVRLSAGKVVGNTLVCPYHGMVYDLEGQCIHVPSNPDYCPPKQACVQSYQIQERYGWIFVCLGEPRNEIPPFPDWNDSSFLKVFVGPYHCNTGAFRAIENFLDVAHFPFVHTDILGNSNTAQIGDYEVSLDTQGLHFHDIKLWQPDPVGVGQGSYVAYNFWAFRPLTAYLRKETQNGECLTILFCVTPTDEEACISWMWVGSNYADASQAADIRAFQDTIFSQDVANLEAHNPKRLPLDPKAEFHAPCDRGSLAYRKWLKQLGVTYSVIS